MATKTLDRDFFVNQGRRGGKLSQKGLTPAQRSASAKRAAEARWKKIDKGLKKLEGTVDRIEAGAERLKKAMKRKNTPV